MADRKNNETTSWNADEVRRQQTQRKQRKKMRRTRFWAIYCAGVVLASCLLAGVGWLLVNDVCSLNKDPVEVKLVIEEGDIVSLDAGVIYKGYQSDAARTHGVGEISDDAKLLIERTRQSFFEGIKFATAGNHLHQISAAIGDYAGSFGYGVVRDLCGHGIGKHMHEDPEIPNFRQFRRGIKLRPGMTLAIEPMVDLGSAEVVWMDDDWTVVTEDWSLSAHYENTILITDGEPEIFTLTESEIATGRWNQYLGRQTEA